MMQNTLKLQENLGDEFFNFSFLWQGGGGMDVCAHTSI